MLDVACLMLIVLGRGHFLTKQMNFVDVGGAAPNADAIRCTGELCAVRDIAPARDVVRCIGEFD